MIPVSKTEISAIGGIIYLAESSRKVRLGSKPDIGGLVDRGPLWSGKQTFEAHVWILVMLTSASERKADLAA